MVSAPAIEKPATAAQLAEALLEAAKQGYQNQVNNVSVNPGTDAVVDIEMIRQK